MNKPYQDNDKVAKQYKQKQLDTMTPLDLLILFYDKAIEYIIKGKELIPKVIQRKPKEMDLFYNTHISSTQKIITELLLALDPKPKRDESKLIKNLFKMYEYLNWRLSQCNTKRLKAEGSKDLDEVVHILSNLRDGWVEHKKRFGYQGRKVEEKIKKEKIEGGNLNLQG